MQNDDGYVDGRHLNLPLDYKVHSEFCKLFSKDNEKIAKEGEKILEKWEKTLEQNNAYNQVSNKKDITDLHGLNLVKEFKSNL